MPRVKGNPNNVVKHPFPATARAEGRTEQVRINGAISKAAKARLMAASGDKSTKKLEGCLMELIRLEGLLNDE